MTVRPFSPDCGIIRTNESENDIRGSGGRPCRRRLRRRSLQLSGAGHAVRHRRLSRIRPRGEHPSARKEDARILLVVERTQARQSVRPARMGGGVRSGRFLGQGPEGVQRARRAMAVLRRGAGRAEETRGHAARKGFRLPGGVRGVQVSRRFLFVKMRLRRDAREDVRSGEGDARRRQEDTVLPLREHDRRAPRVRGCGGQGVRREVRARGDADHRRAARRRRRIGQGRRRLRKPAQFVSAFQRGERRVAARGQDEDAHTRRARLQQVQMPRHGGVSEDGDGPRQVFRRARRASRVPRRRAGHGGGRRLERR